MHHHAACRSERIDCFSQALKTCFCLLNRFHENEDIPGRAAFGDMLNQAAHAFAETPIDRIADDFDIELIAPCERARDRVVGAAVVVKHDAVGGGRVWKDFLETRKEGRNRGFFIVGRQPDPERARCRV